MQALPKIYIVLLLFCICHAAMAQITIPSTKPIAKTQVKSNLTKYLNAKKWDELFPHRYRMSMVNKKGNKQPGKLDLYSFKAFLRAAEMFPQFLQEGDGDAQKRELSAFLANVAHETGGGWDEAPGGYLRWGLYYLEERGCENGCAGYSDTLKRKYPPINGKSYHGRGPLQLSWNYNYGQLSEAYFGIKDSLLQHPELLTKDPVLCFASAIWFWMTAQTPKPSCHDVICGNWIPTAKDSANGRLPGFGAVVNVINGGLECGSHHSDHTKYRYGYYEYFCNYFSVTPGENRSCALQQEFGFR